MKIIWYFPIPLSFIPFLLIVTFSQPELKPLVEKDIPKVVQAIRQMQSKKVLCKLLTRIKVCCATDAQRRRGN